MPEYENRSIECKVKNCHYHDESDHCRAERIEVAPEQECTCCKDTFCKTYREES